MVQTVAHRGLMWTKRQPGSRKATLLKQSQQDTFQCRCLGIACFAAAQEHDCCSDEAIAAGLGAATDALLLPALQLIKSMKAALLKQAQQALKQCMVAASIPQQPKARGRKQMAASTKQHSQAKASCSGKLNCTTNQALAGVPDVL